jgi:predicted NBD/HSP70 family sugar kinase
MTDTLNPIRQCFEAPPLVGLAEPSVLVVEFGGTKTSVVEGKRFIRSKNVDVAPTLHNLDEAIEDVAGRSGVLLAGRAINAVAVSIAGEVSPNGLTIVRGGPLQAYGWTEDKEPDIRGKLADALGVEHEAVTILNDGESAGLAERHADRVDGRLYQDGFLGLIQTVSSGNGGAVYDINGAKNTEPGHTDSGRVAPVQCGCGGDRCIEAHISGDSVAAAWAKELPHIKHMEDLDPTDPRWTEYSQIFITMQERLLASLAERGLKPDKLAYFGSVALKTPGPLTNLTRFMANIRPHVMVTAATYGDLSGLQGAYLATKDKLDQAA